MRWHGDPEGRFISVLTQLLLLYGVHTVRGRVSIFACLHVCTCSCLLMVSVSLSVALSCLADYVSVSLDGSLCQVLTSLSSSFPR
jgi:hypothetical protein